MGTLLFIFFSLFALLVFLTMLFEVIGDAWGIAKQETAEADRKAAEVDLLGLPIVKRVVLKIKLYHTHFDWSVDREEGPKA